MGVKNMALKKETTAVLPSVEIASKDLVVKQDDKHAQKLQLLMVTLKEISNKISMMEVMEQDASSMLSRTDALQTRIKDFENLKLSEKLLCKEKKNMSASITPNKEAQQVIHKEATKKEEDILDKTSRIVTSAIKQEIPRKQGEDEQLKLMTKMLNDIETKVLIIEDMERDTNCMLSRADHLQMKTKFLEEIKKKQMAADTETIRQVSTSISSSTSDKQESARVSTMADVQKMKENILQKGNSSTEI